MEFSASSSTLARTTGFRRRVHRRDGDIDRRRCREILQREIEIRREPTATASPEAPFPAAAISTDIPGVKTSPSLKTL
jgi:hypothetical protein